MIFDDQTLSFIEWIAAALGVVNISLLIFRSVWNYPFGIAMVALYTFIFFEKRLYAESGLQIFFILAQLWGWYLWVKVGGDDDRVPVRWLSNWSRATWLTVTAALSLNLGWVMHQFTNAALPYADAGIAGASVAAQILLAYRRIENWMIWIAIDVVAIALYINRELYPTAGLYGGFLVLSLIGLKEWIAAEKRLREAAAA
jgi:nicotinamide mononucleotide transporter